MIALPLLLVSLALGADPSGPVCAAPDAASEAALRERLVPLLGRIEGPVVPEIWRTLPPEALPLLERIAAADRRTGRRVRALEGAAALGSDGALHRRLASDVAQPFQVRAAAIRGLGRIVARDRLRRELTPLLEENADARIRATAAATLARSAPAEGCAAVRAQVGREQASQRPAFGQALKACGEN